MKHKHSDLIHAWADGAEIQVYSFYEKKWIDSPSPVWDSECQYRIKPKEKFLYLGYTTSLFRYHSSNCYNNVEGYTHAVKIIIDESTGVAKAMEVVK